MADPAFVEGWFIQIRDADEAMKIAHEHGFADSMKAGYSWEWRELKVPTLALGYGWYVEKVVSADTVKVARSTLVEAGEQAIMRIETWNYAKDHVHDGLLIATREDGCVFGFRPGSMPQGGAKFQRLAIVHPTNETPAFMEWAGRAFGQSMVDDAYVYHVRTPKE